MQTLVLKPTKMAAIESVRKLELIVGTTARRTVILEQLVRILFVRLKFSSNVNADIVKLLFSVVLPPEIQPKRNKFHVTRNVRTWRDLTFYTRIRRFTIRMGWLYLGRKIWHICKNLSKDLKSSFWSQMITSLRSSLSSSEIMQPEWFFITFSKVTTILIHISTVIPNYLPLLWCKLKTQWFPNQHYLSTLNR